MNLKEQFQSASTIREHSEEIDGLGLCLFVEPLDSELSRITKKYMSFSTEIVDEEAKVTVDHEKSDMNAYNYGIISMTLHDPDTGQRVFESEEDCRKTLNARDEETGKPLHGGTTINALVSAASKVTRKITEEEVEKN